MRKNQKKKDINKKKNKKKNKMGICSSFINHKKQNNTPYDVTIIENNDNNISVGASLAAASKKDIDNTKLLNSSTIILSSSSTSKIDETTNNNPNKTKTTTMITPIPFNPEQAHILVCDDERSSKILTKWLIEQKYIVTTCLDGNEAITVLNESIKEDINNVNNSSFMAILTDTEMQSYDGTKVLDFVKKNNLLSHIPVILMSADSTPQAIDRYIRRGGNDFISKPITKQVLLKTVQSICEQVLEYDNTRNIRNQGDKYKAMILKMLKEEKNNQITTSFLMKNNNNNNQHQSNRIIASSYTSLVNSLSIKKSSSTQHSRNSSINYGQGGGELLSLSTSENTNNKFLNVIDHNNNTNLNRTSLTVIKNIHHDTQILIIDYDIQVQNQIKKWLKNSLNPTLENLDIICYSSFDLAIDYIDDHYATISLIICDTNIKEEDHPNILIDETIDTINSFKDNNKAYNNQLNKDSSFSLKPSSAGANNFNNDDLIHHNNPNKGLQLLHILANDHDKFKHIPVLLIGYMKPSDMSIAVANNCNNFINKPITKDLLLNKIKSILLSIEQKKKTLKLIQRAKKYQQLLDQIRNHPDLFTQPGASPIKNTPQKGKLANLKKQQQQQQVNTLNQPTKEDG